MQDVESYESRMYRYELLNEPGKCVQLGCGADAAVSVNIHTPNLMTGYAGHYCALHAEDGAARALAFVMRGRR